MWKRIADERPALANDARVEPEPRAAAAAEADGPELVGVLVDEPDSYVVVGRDQARLEGLAHELGDLFSTLAIDVTNQRGLHDTSRTGDVVICTVGPFTRYGDAIVQAVTQRGLRYLDSTGEPPFVRRMFEHHDGPAHQHGATCCPPWATTTFLGLSRSASRTPPAQE